MKYQTQDQIDRNDEERTLAWIKHRSKQLYDVIDNIGTMTGRALFVEIMEEFKEFWSKGWEGVKNKPSTQHFQEK